MGVLIDKIINFGFRKSVQNTRITMHRILKVYDPNSASIWCIGTANEIANHICVEKVLS